MVNSDKTPLRTTKRQEVKETKTYLPTGMDNKINAELEMKGVKRDRGEMQ